MARAMLRMSLKPRMTVACSRVFTWREKP
jgi:hypothetical protein